MTTVGQQAPMMTHLCMQPYERGMRYRAAAIRVPDGTVMTLFCQYPDGHGDRHSWEDIKCEDTHILRTELTEVLPLPTAQPVHTAGEDGPFDPPTILADLCEAITAGEYDEWLEYILAVGHDRKRARRGVRGFRRRR